MPTLGLPEVFIHAKDGMFDDTGNIAEKNKKFLQDWVFRYILWVKQHAA